MTQIVGFLGKKQSGKGACCNFMTMLHLCDMGVCKYARMNEQSKIEVGDIFGERVPGKDWFLLDSPEVDLSRLIYSLGTVKTYSLADPLKKMAIDVLGLPEEGVYGTDEQKNKKTPLKWEKMPGIITKEQCQEHMNDYGVGTDYTVREYRQHLKEDFGLILHGCGRMSTIEILQYLNTEIFRKIDSNIWIKKLLRDIEEEHFDMALVSNVKFDNEIKKIRKKEGLIIGLTRGVYSSDGHESERPNFDLCDAVINNEKMSVLEQGHAVYDALVQLKCSHLPKKGIQHANA